ncbi:hypothetical protein LR48_Vigan10g026300 [Vigna angularis]|uniref:Uncharacterized protein n=2 Tax=Phaseolus angularis TaxID=3914 RepID=A0A0L9VH46_PHAAN|nr:uncharacterized protein LOC128193540 [Vigna angularis]KOM54371.1 hypothetical protein LR48_Vigan10g026300 [Vigna angularis]BAU02757.1 hypothetical protein VIGAN_11233300 [Vigna angularis var. angularis]
MVFLIMIPCSVPLFLFSLTSTLILPSSSSSHVSFNTWSVFQDCSSITQSSGSDESANEAAVNNTSLNLPVVELNVHRVLSTRNQSGNTTPAEPHVFSAVPAEPHVFSNVTIPHASIIYGFFLLLILINHSFSCFR